MGKLKSRDFRVISRRLIGAALGIAVSASGAASAPSARLEMSVAAPGAVSLDGIQLAQASSSENVKNIQRLLTLLADRYSAKYGTVNPGRVDGSYGAETKAAIRKYQEIAGIEPGSRTNEQLVADILATLAQMSAEQPEESATASATGEPSESPAAATASKPAISPAPAPALTAPAALPKTAAAANTANRPAPVPPAKVPVPTPVAAVAQATTPGKPTDRVYFSQLASLRTLESAQREWQRIFEANRAALNGEQVYFEEADVAGRGTFHRILVGPIPERDAAKTLCGYLKQNDQPCVVISRFLSSLRRLKDKNGQLAPPTLSPSSAIAAQKDQTPPAQETAASAPASDTPSPATPDSDATNSDTNDSPSPSPETAETVQETVPSTASGTTENSAENTEKTVTAPAPAQTSTVEQATAPSIQEASKVFEQNAEDDKSTADTAASAAAAAPVANAETVTENRPEMPKPVAAPAPTVPAISIAPAVDTSTTTEPTTETTDSAEPTQTATLLPFSRTPTTPDSGPPSGEPAPTTDPSGQVDSSDPAPAASASTGRRTPTLLGILADIRDYLGGTYNILGFVAAVILGAATLQFVWWRRSRNLAFSQVFRPGNFTFGMPVPADSEPADALAALETDFDSEQLRQSRTIRDEFLRDILGEDVDLDDTTEKKEPAIRINSSLKSLLISDPAQYKTIFLNWIFLSKVGSALDQREITMEDLNGHFGREFKLLQNYFKIHLLELDARHRIRKELPGLFYCLQMAQQRERQVSGAA